MKILAIDFSSTRRGVALGLAEAGAFRVLAQRTELSGQATHAFAMIEEVLQQAGVVRGEIDRLAIGLGPGSYAGIRVALALAQGWQLATGVRTVGVSSMGCLAATASAHGRRGPVAIIVDAQRSEFYRAEYELTDAGFHAKSPLEIVSRAAIDELIAGGVPVLGPEVQGAFPSAEPLFPDAGELAHLASQLTDELPAGQLEPIYLRAVSFVKAPSLVQAFLPENR